MSETSPRNRPLLVSFSGIDGAGKSTQISQLRDALETAGLRVKLITFWDDVVALKSLREGVGHRVFHGDKGVGSPEAPIRRRDKDVQAPVVTLFRMAFYFLDAIALRRTVRRALSGNCNDDVIIFDRFLYDELANLNLGGRFTRTYIRMLLRLVLRPDVPFVLDADPDAAFARKPEYPLEFLRANRRAYLGLARMAGMSVIAPASIEHAHAEVLGKVLRALHGGVAVAGRDLYTLSS